MSKALWEQLTKGDSRGQSFLVEVPSPISSREKIRAQWVDLPELQLHKWEGPQAESSMMREFKHHFPYPPPNLDSPLTLRAKHLF